MDVPLYFAPIMVLLSSDHAYLWFLLKKIAMINF